MLQFSGDPETPDVLSNVSSEKHKPPHDEQTLARLLEAAYVLQEHNRERQKLELNREFNREYQQRQTEKPKKNQEASRAAREIAEKPEPPQVQAKHETAPAPKAPADEAANSGNGHETLAPIVETQYQIQSRHLDLEETIKLVVERTATITHAGGAAIFLIDKEHHETAVCRAVSGGHTTAPGTGVALHQALSCSSLRTGEVGRYPDVSTEFLLDGATCRARGIAALITVPVFHEGKTAGALELYFPTTNSFAEPQVHTSQLMAGLIGEALASDAQASLKKSLAAERASVLDALEKLQPNLAALTEMSAAKEAAALENTQEEDKEEATQWGHSDPPVAAPVLSAAEHGCRKCGHELMEQEQFCGKCGSPRSGDYEPPNMQSKVATLWLMQQLNSENGSAANGTAIAKAAAAPQGATAINPKPEYAGSQIVPSETAKSQTEKTAAEKSAIIQNLLDQNSLHQNSADSSQDKTAAGGQGQTEFFLPQNFTLEALGLPEMRLFDGNGGFHATAEEAAKSAETAKLALPKNMDARDLDPRDAAFDSAFEDDLEAPEDRAENNNLHPFDPQNLPPNPLAAARQPRALAPLDLHQLDPNSLDLQQLDLQYLDESEVDSRKNEAPEVAVIPSAATLQSDICPAEKTEKHEEVSAASDTRPTWTSAANAREFFEQFAGGKSKNSLLHLWNTRRGDIYLAFAVILVAGVVRWGIWSNHAVSASRATSAVNKTAPQPNQQSSQQPATDTTADLSAFDRMLISLGLAEAPAAPEYKGNPDTKVWIDTQSALYYCPADELYGKTPKGKYTSQRDAQLDQYEPALQKMCE